MLPAVIFFTIPVPNVVRIEPGRKGKTSMAFPIFVRPAGIVITRLERPPAYQEKIQSYFESRRSEEERVAEALR